MAKKACLYLRALAEMSETQTCFLMRRRECRAALRHLSSRAVLASRRAVLPRPCVSSQAGPTRNFVNLVAPLTARRIQYTENRTIGYSAEQLYNIIANVEEYQQFVPWCKKSKVTKGRNGNVQATLEIGFPPFIERYTSEVTVVPNHQVRAVCTDGSLFNHLETLWRFTPQSGSQGDSCIVEFYVTFEFKSLLHSQLAAMFFDEVVKQMVGAFEKRARALHPPSVLGQEAAGHRAT
ncbi:coenzyme Q-binding protein COQ10 homolog, mitochondrial [Brachyhypopomus gauderio]|uniref:coenzyme Q-binding protein COQ10 homolog, mitochondrial n=1 Tax=Brachyhypopomus gauderio TaxID=698409 RepID=UPI004042388A